MAKKKVQEKKKYDNPNVVGLRAEVLEQPITQTLETNYMPYAMSVIVSRAIPEIDGFKPSHRKLLYTMFKMGLLTGARTKSANIVGQTMKQTTRSSDPTAYLRRPAGTRIDSIAGPVYLIQFPTESREQFMNRVATTEHMLDQRRRF